MVEIKNIRDGQSGGEEKGEHELVVFKTGKNKYLIMYQKIIDGIIYLYDVNGKFLHKLNKGTDYKDFNEHLLSNKSYKSYKNNGNNINALVFGKAFDLEVGHEGKILKLYIESDIDKEFNGEVQDEKINVKKTERHELIYDNKLKECLCEEVKKYFPIVNYAIKNTNNNPFVNVWNNITGQESTNEIYDKKYDELIKLLKENGEKLYNFHKDFNLKIYSDIIINTGIEKIYNKEFSKRHGNKKLLKPNIRKKLVVFTDEIVEDFYTAVDNNIYNPNIYTKNIKLFQKYNDFVEKFIKDFKDRIFLKDRKYNADELLQQFTSINDINIYFNSIREFINLYIDYDITMSENLFKLIEKIKDLLMYDIEEKEKSKLTKYIDKVSKFYIELQTQTQPKAKTEAKAKAQNRKNPQKGKGYIIDDPLDSEFYDNNKFEKSIADDPYDSDFYN